MKKLVYSLNREFSYFVLLILYVQNGYSAAIGSKSSILKDISDGVNNFKSLELLYESANSTLFDSLMAYLVPAENKELKLGNQTSDAKIRSKRQSGGGKFVDAANMGQSKVMGLYTQMLKNSWSDVYVGGAHPLHHEVPKSIVYLFKQKIYAYFFPDVGVPDKTQ